MLNKVRQNCTLNNPYSYHIRIKTTNSFPTACGLASSASGFACLAICLSEAFGYNGNVSELARLGSGSACRSCYGGFVKWTSGTTSNDSIATKLFDSEHWPNFNIFALILEDERKKVIFYSYLNNSENLRLNNCLIKTGIKYKWYANKCSNK